MIMAGICPQCKENERGYHKKLCDDCRDINKSYYQRISEHNRIIKIKNHDWIDSNGESWFISKDMIKSIL